jgi:acid phosphatase family membrane protein YuiD
MKRALIVVTVALLIASVSGITDASMALALEQAAAQTGGSHEREIASRAARIGVNHIVRIERVDGSRANALLEDVLPDAIVVTVIEGETRRRETIPFAEIRKIDEVRGHALRNVLIGVGIGVAVLVGTCAAALSSETSPQVRP